MEEGSPAHAGRPWATQEAAEWLGAQIEVGGWLGKL